MSVLDVGGRSMQGRNFLPLLGAAAQQMLELHRRWSERPDAVAAEIDRRLESTAALPREGAVERLVLLLRLRDLHRYVEAEPELRIFKVALLDGMLRHREPVRRWNEAKDLIVSYLPAVLGTRADVRLSGTRAALKREISEPGGRLGRVLRLCALLNLEAVGETPPPNWVVRFVRGKFPEHVWEVRQSASTGGSAASGVKAPGASPVTAWQPTALLARWEYLAAEVMEHVFRGPTAAGGPAWDGGSGRPGSGTDEPSPVAVEARSGQHKQAYVRLEADAAMLAQMPLLTMEPGALLPELMRHVRQKLGAEGVRQAVLVLAASASTPQGRPFTVDVAALGAACGSATRREVRERARLLDSVVALLGNVTVQRVVATPNEEGSPRGGRIRTTRLVIVTGWEGAGADVERMLVLADSVLWNEAGRPLGEIFSELPAGVLALQPREFPGALLIAAYTRRRFAEEPGAAIEVTASGLMQGAGLVAEITPKSLEVLKRDLHRLQEIGVLGRWRIIEGSGEKPRVRRADPLLRLEGLQRPRGLGNSRARHGGRHEDRKVNHAAILGGECAEQESRNPEWRQAVP